MERTEEVKVKSKVDTHLADRDKVIRNKIRRQEKKRNFTKSVPFATLTLKSGICLSFFIH